MLSAQPNRTRIWVTLCCLSLSLPCLADEANVAGRPAALPGIVFVGGPIIDGEFEGEVGSYHWRDGYVYPKGATFNAWERTVSAMRPGRNLFALVPATPDGKVTQLT